MCKNSGTIVSDKKDVSDKKEETKKGCSGDCKKYPFNVFIPPEADTHSGLVNTTEDIKDIIENNEK